MPSNHLPARVLELGEVWVTRPDDRVVLLDRSVKGSVPLGVGVAEWIECGVLLDEESEPVCRNGKGYPRTIAAIGVASGVCSR